MDGQAFDGRETTARNLAEAAHQHEALSKAGLLERAFTRLFSGLVYPQIWEDPVADMAALGLGPRDRVMTISSGGCNALSYLTADVERVVAVDLNAHHVALVRLKLAGLRAAPNYASFFRFFGEADHPENPRFYREHLRGHLDDWTRDWWEARDGLFGRRIDLFAKGLYRRGLLGRFIWAGHVAARLFGVRLARFAEARDLDAQRRLFDAEIAPLFDRRLVRWITSRKASLFGLGIPPAQYDALCGDGEMAPVLRRRLEKLLCDFPMAENYFAWQAVARRYAPGDAGPLPPYLQSRWFETLRARADRVTVENRSFTERAGEAGAPDFDAFVLLDAQDWMTDAQLDALWGAIAAAARPGARVLFRTAAEPSLLPGRLDPALLARWRYDEGASAQATRDDRSAIYGGVHLYRFEG